MGVQPDEQPASIPREPRARWTARRAGGFWGALGLLVAVGLAYRLLVIASPLGEIEGDEAVVGLMARHIAFLGDRPVFYYGQPYLGSLEAFSAALPFKLLGASTLLLKLVPTVYSLGFLAATAIMARRLFGTSVAVASAVYLALPPAMWAVWSTKARGGYAELLLLGALLIWLTLWLGDRPPSRRGAVGWGLVAGLAAWTNPLAVVYLLPCVVYLAARRFRERGALARRLAEPALACVGALVGAWPMVAYNLDNGFPTLWALLAPPDEPVDVGGQLVRFFRVGVPVLAGLGQPTTSVAMFERDWGNRPAGHLWVAVLLVAVLALAVLAHAGAVLRLFRGRGGSGSGPALLVLLAASVPIIVSATRFGFLVAEPRYALPLYSAVPLGFAALWRLPRPVRVLGVVGAVALNVYSLVSTDVALWRPEQAEASTAATRAQLIRALEADDRHQVYTDYWIAYPLMFESRERIFAYVIAGGFNRYIPPADNVQRTADPVWVFMRGSEAEQDFLARLRGLGGSARVKTVSVYRVYEDVRPLEAMRPG